VGGDFAALGINAKDDLMRKLLCDLCKPRLVTQRPRADDDALDAPAEHQGNIRVSTQPAAQLTRHAGLADDALNAIAVDRPALFGAVEIDDVQKRRPLVDPAPRHGGGIGAEDRLLSVVPLPQAHALAAADVDGWQNEHDEGSRVSCEERGSLSRQAHECQSAG